MKSREHLAIYDLDFECSSECFTVTALSNNWRNSAIHASAITAQVLSTSNFVDLFNLPHRFEKEMNSLNKSHLKRVSHRPAISVAQIRSTKDWVLGERVFWVSGSSSSWKKLFNTLSRISRSGNSLVSFFICDTNDSHKLAHD